MPCECHRDSLLKHMKPLVAIPTYNEARNLPRLVPLVLASTYRPDLIIIDDGSPDGTGEIADVLASADERIHVMHRPTKAGLGTAYRDAFAWALEHHYDVVIEMDADFSHNPADIDRLLEKSDGFNLVIGSRYVPGGNVVNWAWGRRMLSRYGNRYAAFCLGLPVADATAGYRAYSRKVLEALDLDAITTNGYAFQIEMAYSVWKLGFPVIEIPINFVDRRVGHSKMSRKIVIEGLYWCTRQGLRDLRAGLRNRE